MTQQGKSWASMDEAARKEYWASLALRHCRGLGARTAARLVRHFGSAYAAVQGRQLWNEAGVNKGQATELATGSWRVTARDEWDRARDLSASIVLWTDPQYPRAAALRHRRPRAAVLPGRPFIAAIAWLCRGGFAQGDPARQVRGGIHGALPLGLRHIHCFGHGSWYRQGRPRGRPRAGGGQHRRAGNRYRRAVSCRKFCGI